MPITQEINLGVLPPDCKPGSTLMRLHNFMEDLEDNVDFPDCEFMCQTQL